MGVTSSQLYDDQDLSHLLRLIRGDAVPEELDDQLGDSARVFAKAMRSATNGVAPVEKLATLPGGDELARLLLVGRLEMDSAGPIEKVVPAETNFIFRTAREIAQATPDRPEWVVHGLAARGATTELDAKIKAGKTEFIARLIKAILSGDDFLERPTRQTRVVYLTEQTATTFREPLRRAGLLETDDLVVLSWADTIGYRWEVVAAAAIAKCEEIGAHLLVVDTLGAFARIKDEGENSSGAAAEAMAPLQMAAARGLAIIVLRHDRKSGGDVGESARGSSAFGGAADIILALRRGEGNSRPTIRALHRVRTSFREFCTVGSSYPRCAARRT
jgi:AAA domain